MSTGTLIMLLVGSVVVLWSARCAIQARRSSIAARIVAVFILAPLAMFCIFGFLAAMEPGEGHLFWRIGYLAVFGVLAFTIVWLVIAKPRGDDD